ncbi:hypothetical Protein YC6258_00862 [Gynuella sunshinyii YC6258]|uniref:Uncharacterized protein n=1 Tax=Gynuella sunshinyii YC6258 TaxID=1445510 RepID=A0A0C5VEE2_9GAMM|nr:hypothetical Protein YC6258_00862 [Gynuella sunshinyii YC6258]
MDIESFLKLSEKHFDFQSVSSQIIFLLRQNSELKRTLLDSQCSEIFIRLFTCNKIFKVLTK